MTAEMSPQRALTIAIAQVIEADRAAGVPWPIGGRKVDQALAAASLATRILEKLPETWTLATFDLASLESKLDELAATTRWLMVDRLITDGHAKDIKTASRIARDPARLRELYPDAFK